MPQKSQVKIKITIFFVFLGLVLILIDPFSQKFWGVDKSLGQVYSTTFLGCTHYVSPSGNDSSNGSQLSPWKTIKKALLSTGPGHVVCLRDGIYSQDIEMRGDVDNPFGKVMGGSQSGWWTIQSYPGEMAILNKKWEAFGIQYSRFQNLTFESGGSLGVTSVSWKQPVQRSHHIEIRGLVYSGEQVRYGFIQFLGDDSLIEDNIITLSGAGDNLYYGISLHNGNNNIVKGNVVSGASGYNIQVYDERKGYNDPQTFYNDVIVENNIVFNSSGHSGLIISQGGDTVINSIIVRNNISYGNKKYGIDLTNYGSENMNGVKVYNNTIFKNKDDGIYIGYNNLSSSEIVNNIIYQPLFHINKEYDGTIGLTVNNNLYGPGAARLKRISDSNARVGDPSFVNSTAGDFHIQVDSAALNQGANLFSDVPYDRDENPRPQIGYFDLGAYELVASDGCPPGGCVSVPGSFELQAATSGKNYNGFGAEPFGNWQNPFFGIAPLQNVDLWVKPGIFYDSVEKYGFDCENDGLIEMEKMTAGNKQSAIADLCNYEAPGSYIAKVTGFGGFFCRILNFCVELGTGTVEIQVSTSIVPPSIDLSLESPSTLIWSSSNATSCVASAAPSSIDWAGPKPLFGSQSIGDLTTTTIFTLSCSGANGVASDSFVEEVPLLPLAPDFSLSKSGELFVNIVGTQPVTSNTAQITVGAFDGFASNVNLSVQSVSPNISGATFNFSDSSLTSGEFTAGSDFSVTVPANTPPGIYTIKIRGVDGGLVREIDLRFNVNVLDPSFREI